jgi:hypothetical protein
MWLSRSVIALCLCGCAYTPPPARVDCSFGAIAYAWDDSNRDGLPNADEMPLKGVHVHLDPLNPRGPYPSGAARLGITDQRGFTFFAIYLAGCPTQRFELHADAPRGFVPTTPLRVPVATGDTVRFGFARRGA